MLDHQFGLQFGRVREPELSLLSIDTLEKRFQFEPRATAITGLLQVFELF